MFHDWFCLRSRLTNWKFNLIVAARLKTVFYLSSLLRGLDVNIKGLNAKNSKQFDQSK